MPSNISHLTPITAATNTIIVTNLDHSAFFSENFMEIKVKFERYGPIYKLIPIKSFNRMLIIYFRTLDAKTAKSCSDKMIFMNKVIRVYYGLHTPVHYDDETDKHRHLDVPKLTTSPPGALPTRWVQTHETDPNSGTLVDDLAYRLANICNITDADAYNDTKATLQIPFLSIVSNDLGTNNHEDDVPAILVQDWDESSSPSSLSQINSFNYL